MMISPDGRVVFIEVPRTGSTAFAQTLQRRGWVQNGRHPILFVPTVDRGRHAFLTETAASFLEGLGAYTIGVVRNPWDRMASLWRSAEPSRIAFSTLMEKPRLSLGGVDILRFTQSSWLYGVRDVIRYEELDATLATASLRIPGAPFVLPRVNVSPERPEVPWTNRLKALVAERFSEDIARWGYTGPSE